MISPDRLPCRRRVGRQNRGKFHVYFLETGSPKTGNCLLPALLPATKLPVTQPVKSGGAFRISAFFLNGSDLRSA